MHLNNGWLVEALDGHYGAKSEDRQGFKPKYIVIHGTAGGSSAAGIDNWFTNGKNADGSPVLASSHVIIDQAGTVIQGISFDQAAWGNGGITAGHAAFLPANVNPNLYTISIEFVKSHTDNSDQLTAAQLAAGIDVIQSISGAYQIPVRAADAAGGILSHADIDPVNRSGCPGPFPWSQLYGGNTVAVTQAQYDDLYKKLEELRKAWDIVVPEKNSLIALRDQLTAENAQLKKQLAAAGLSDVLKADITAVDTAVGKLKKDAGV